MYFLYISNFDNFLFDVFIRISQKMTKSQLQAERLLLSAFGYFYEYKTSRFRCGIENFQRVVMISRIGESVRENVKKVAYVI